MTDITERLRLRTDPSQMLMCYPPRPAPDMLCYEAAAKIERLRSALEDIANERGVCLTCGKLAQRGYKGGVFCDPHLFGLDQGCKWSPQNPIDVARAALEED